MKYNFGIEQEFFVLNSEAKLVPAYNATSRLDGNPVVGEVKTDVFGTIVDVVFDIMKRLHIESKEIAAVKNEEIGEVHLSLIPEISVEDDFIRALRRDKTFLNFKTLELLEEKSIYGGELGKILPVNLYKASLQLNISLQKKFTYHEYQKVQIDDKVKWDKIEREKNHSEVFDYVSPIRILDEAFADEIKATNRVPGVYSIKDGIHGKRVEYRSLPNNINLMKLIEVVEGMQKKKKK